MAKTRGGLSGSPSSPTPRPHRAAMGAAASPPVQAPAIPPSEGKPFSAPIPHQEPPTDPVPPADQATSLFLGHQRREPSSRVLESHPTHLSRATYRGLSDSCGDYPETVIRRPMIAGPPIEGNLDCRDRSFHSETYFDIEALRQQPELRDSFRLLQRYHMGIFSLLGNSTIPE
ncbi:hypothetical protein CK203_112026 [Vitis vinifera]|uniref:Uncharacterized protein n=1 Tax=Vitis vinifera TaxID=29760 RepID=A0A438CBD3_VITVI|nr:hypothetical protein CK203_112026 [Vitis vinifera]